MEIKMPLIKMATRTLLLPLLLISTCILISASSKKKDDSSSKTEAEKWKQKDIRDYNDADVERLFDQWEEGDEDELEEDELPEWKRKSKPLDMSKLNPNDPEQFLKMSKKGKTLMMFATIAGNPTEAETEKISGIWHSSLFNANIQTQRFVVGSNRVLFMCTDGALAWEVKDFLVQQENCESVEIEGKTYTGKGAKETSDGTSDKKKIDKSKKESSKGSSKETKTKAKEERKKVDL